MLKIKNKETITIYDINISNELVKEINTIFENHRGYHNSYKKVKEMEEFPNNIKEGYCYLDGCLEREELIKQLKETLRFCKENNIKYIQTIEQY